MTGPLALSVALHAVIGVAAVAWIQPAGLSVDRTASLELVEPLDREKLGVDRSDAVTITWLGFSKPTEHSGALSEVEQSQLEIAETPEVLPNAPAETSASVAPTLAEEVAPQQEQPSESIIEQAEAVRESIETAVADAAATLRPLLDGLLALAARPAPLEKAPPTTTATTGDTGESTTNPGGANREADATTIETIDARPGQVVAARGLEIVTIRPKFQTITRFTAWPHNPEVSIEFGVGGKVTSARFQPGRSTGHSEVDQALLDAIYQWRARGPRIDSLTGSRPPVVINMRILMR